MKLKTTELEVIIPFYNEEENIEYFFNNLFVFFDSLEKIKDLAIFFILVDNGSVDLTYEKLNKKVESFKYKKNLKIIKIKKKQGYGYGICQGLKKSTKDFTAWTHSDGQTDIMDIIIGAKKLKELIKNNYNKKILIKGKEKIEKLFQNLFQYQWKLLLS